MHLKNFSLLREYDGSWHLADAYDLLPVKMLMPDDTEDMALTLNGNAVSRVADALASGIDAGLGDSLVSDEFASGFARLVRANLDRLV